ncbi:MAG: hypothetical protein H7840_03440 [Alphaproteobacteria bacterium]
MRRILAAVAVTITLSHLAPAPAPAQQTGGEVPPPPATAPVFAPPSRDGEFMERRKREDDVTTPKEAEAIQSFRSAYEAHGRPRLVLYWNRQLSEAVSEWSAVDRIVVSGGGSAEGDVNWKGGGETVIESQHRVASPAQQRPRYKETWEWDFLQGFLAPMLEAKAVVIDRTAVTRLAGAGQPPGALGGRSDVLEATALKDMADLMIEVLIAPSEKSTIGYEMHARVLDTHTGQIVASVNSRSMEGWGRPHDYLVSEQGFDKLDDDDDMSGPILRKRYEASAQGFTKRKRPPKPRTVARQLSMNVMEALKTAWRP